MLAARCTGPSATFETFLPVCLAPRYRSHGGLSRFGGEHLGRLKTRAKSAKPAILAFSGDRLPQLGDQVVLTAQDDLVTQLLRFTATGRTHETR